MSMRSATSEWRNWTPSGKAVKPMNETAHIETVNGTTAGKWLERNTANRPLRRHTVERYARLMREDRWFLTPDAIAFNEEGDLLNGQHRLNAVVLSGTAQRFIIARYLPAEAFPFLDDRNVRRLPDHLAMQGYAQANELSAAVRAIAPVVLNQIVARAQFTGGESGKFENDVFLDFVEAFPEVRDSTRIAKNIHHNAVGDSITPTVATFIHFFYRDFMDAEAFLSQVFEGVGITSKKDPTFILRRLLQQERATLRNRSNLPRDVMFAYAIIGANLFLKSEKRTFLKWVPTKANPFPQMEVDLPVWEDRGGGS